MKLNFSPALETKLHKDAQRLSVQFSDFLREIVFCLYKINDYFDLTPNDIEFNDNFNYLNFDTYVGVLCDHNKQIISYVSVIPPYLGTRSGYIAQQLFGGAVSLLDTVNNNNKKFLDLFNKPLYIIDICRDSFPASSALNAYIAKEMGFYYQAFHHENGEAKLISEGMKLVKNLQTYDELIKVTSENKIDNVFFELDNVNKIIHFKDNRFQGKPRLTNEPYFFVIKAYLAIQMARLEGYVIDTSSLNNINNITIKVFREYGVKVNSSTSNFKQLILYGAPGTGKSYEVNKIVKSSLGLDEDEEIKDLENVFRLTVYPDYSYSDFIGSIMPVMNKDSQGDVTINYEFKKGIFTDAIVYAFANPTTETFLIVEEMSRGDIAGIFGDMFQLLDRNKFGVSEYSVNNDFIVQELKKKGVVVNKIYFPKNLSIIGTVNTSDQNVYVIDTAFTRRFDYKYISVKPIRNALGNLINSFEFTLDDVSFEWNRFYMSINEFIVSNLGLAEDKQIGQFFIKFDNYFSDKEKLNAIQNKLLHYLWDDVENIALNDNYSLFNKYDSFSSLYFAFEKGENIFSKAFISIYDDKNLN